MGSGSGVLTFFGTSASKIAGELLADVQTRVVFRQATDQLDVAQKRLKLNSQNTELLAQLTKGRSLWIVANRKAVVHHVVGAHELALTFTDAAMTA